MLVRGHVFLSLLLVLLGIAGCAVSPEVAERRESLAAGIDAILVEAREDAAYGKPMNCLSDHQYRSFHALDDSHILFKGRQGKLWINTLRSRCPDLDHGSVLRIRSTTSPGRMCNLDSFAVDDWFTYPWYRRWPWQWRSAWGSGINCTLGKFQPVSEEQVEAIEDLIRQNKR